jgi:dTDP-glucose 4,6-dehydratase
LAIAACDEAVGKVINIGPGKGISVGELASTIFDICESSARIECDEQRIRPERSEVFKLICNSQRAKKILQWESQYPLRRGLEETVAWMRENLHRYKPNIYNV